nr:fibronectin type III domain-containing protein [Bacteroidales bacterium]
MKRRDFIKTSALLAAAAGSGELAKAATLSATKTETGHPAEPEEPGEGPLLVSAPMLQNFADTSVGVAFAVSALANGYVLIGEKPDLSDARKFLCGGYRVTDIEDRVIRVRITGLKPATRYYYRIGADRIRYDGGYRMKILGNEEDS